MSAILLVNLNLSPHEREGCLRIAKALRRLRPRLRARIVHFRDAFTRDVSAFDAIVFGPQGTPFSRYDASFLPALRRFVEGCGRPVLGICGGHQALALAFGGEVGPTFGGQTQSTYKGMRKVMGCVAVQSLGHDSVLKDLSPSTPLLESHVEEVTRLPDGFVVTASSDLTPIEAMRHVSRPWRGVQFHPERAWTRGARAGRAILDTWLRTEGLCLALILATSLCACGESSVEPFTMPDPGVAPLNCRPLEPRGRFLRDAQGRARFLHGVNVTSSAKYDPLHVGIVTKEDFQTMASLGFEVVRLLTFWSAITPEEGKVDEAYLKRLDERIKWASDAGLLVLLDMHQDLFGEGFGDNGAPKWACDASHYAAYQPAQPWYTNYLNPHVQACFDGLYAFGTKAHTGYVDAWRILAKRYSYNSHIAGFDLMNEPHWGSKPAADFHVKWLWPFFIEIIDAIRAEDPQRAIFIEPHTAAMVDLGMKGALVGRDCVVFAPHAYHIIVHDGGPYDGDPSLMDAFVTHFEAMAKESGNLPLFMGEFGNPAGVDNEALFLRDVLDRFDQALAGWTVWSWDIGGFGMLEADRTLRRPYADALGRPHVRAVPGTPTLTTFGYGAIEPHVLRAEFTTTTADAGQLLEVWGGWRWLVQAVTDKGKPCEFEIIDGVVQIHLDPTRTSHVVEVVVQPTP